MEDSSFEGWTSPVMDYPEGYMVPRAPTQHPGYLGDVRVLPKATPDAIRYAERSWPQRDAEDFDRVGKRWVERGTGHEYHRVKGNPLLADDSTRGVAELFIVLDDSLIFLSRAGAQSSSKALGSVGGWRGR